MRATRQHDEAAPAITQPARPAPARTPLAALHEAAGNRAVALAVQRARLNVRPKDGTISGVSAFPKRPPSNLRSGQGQHLTAYVAFEDTILSNVRDRTPHGAALQLIVVVNAIKALPAMEKANAANRHVHAALDVASVALAGAAAEDAADAAKTVGAAIDHILAARNAVPGTAVSIHDTRGHGEAASAGSLETIETGLRTGKAAYGDKEAAQAVGEMWHLFDYDPPAPGDATILEAVAKKVLTHMLSMRLAYPQVWEWLSGKDEKFHLMPFLIANAGADGLPLPRLGKATLGKVKEYVYARL